MNYSGGGYQPSDNGFGKPGKPLTQRGDHSIKPMTGYCDKGHPITIKGDIDENGQLFYPIPKQCEMCEGESVTFELWVRSFMSGMLLSDNDSARAAYLSAKAAWDAATKEAKVMQDLAPIKAEIERRRAKLRVS